MKTGGSRVADRVIKRQAVGPLPIPSPMRTWTLPASALSRRSMESITSIKTLIECPLAWALQYGARIRPGVLNVLPDDEQLVGVLAHAVVENLFPSERIGCQMTPPTRPHGYSIALPSQSPLRC